MKTEETAALVEHELKCWPEFFRAILSGEKTFELRKDDRGFRAGHTLWLREWRRLTVKPTTGEYTGRDLRVTVTYILSGWGLERDYVVMGFHLPAASLLSQPEPQGTASERDKARADGILAQFDGRFCSRISEGRECALKNAIASALAGERESAAKVAENPYGDAVAALGGDEPKAVGLKIAAAIRAGERQGE